MNEPTKRHDSRVNTSRTWLSIFLIGYLLIASLAYAAPAFAPAPYGDLTRIGQVSEDLFGWKSAQPTIDDKYRVNSPINEADVLVIGDSFSYTIAWQSILQKAGLKVHTARWEKVLGVCSNTAAWLAENGFKGRFVVVESVERYLSRRLGISSRCISTRPPGPPLLAMKLPEPTFGLNWDGGSPWDAYEVWKRSEVVEKTKTDMELPHGDSTLVVSVLKVPRGCVQFSHKLCDRALFLKEELSTPPLTRSDALAMRKISDSIHAAKTIWMVVPNKYTVYVDPGRNAEFKAAFSELSMGPDLFALAEAERWKTKDLYMPNDTHWSKAGHLYFGQTMMNWMHSLGP